jgi:PKD repeat protein
VTDAFGNPIPGITVNWSVTGGGQVSAASTQTDAAGQTSVQRTLGSTAGEQTTLASADGLVGSPVTFTHTATAGNAARVIVVSGNGQQGLPGSQLTNPLVVEELDAENNPIVNIPVAWVIGTGDGSATPETSTTDAQGRASTQWTLGPLPGRNTLTAVVSGVGTAAFNATATKVPSTTTITSHQPEPSIVDQPVEVIVQVSGSGGTPTGTVSVTGEGSSPCTITLSNGSGSCTLTFPSNGNKTITATYGGDSRFNGSSDSKAHQVNSAPQPPIAAFSFSCTDLTCSFDSGASTDPDGTIVSRTWDFGDGSTLSDQVNPTHAYATGGTYNVKLTVRDDGGATAEITHQVTVTAPPSNSPPVAVPDVYSTPTGQVLSVDAPGVLANDTDSENNPLTAQLVSGPAQGLVDLDSDGSFTYFPGIATGTQDTFTYSVSDGTSTSTATVTINFQ